MVSRKEKGERRVMLTKMMRSSEVEFLCSVLT